MDSERGGGGRGRHGGGPPAPVVLPLVSSHCPSTLTPSASSSSTSQNPWLQAALCPSRDFDRKLALSSTPSSSSQPPAPSQTPQLHVATTPSSLKSDRDPARPGWGFAGRKCVIRVNHFLVDLIDKDVHHYDATITPEVASIKVDTINELVTLYRESHLGKYSPVFDGRKSLYTAGSLPFSSKDFVVKLVDKLASKERKESKYNVAIKFAGKADLHHLQQFLDGMQLDAPQETLQVLDDILRSAPSTNLGETGILGDGLKYWKGFHQSLWPTQMGLSHNVDMSARAFYERVLVSKFVEGYCNNRDLRRPLSDQDQIKVKKALKNIRVELVFRDGRQCKISGVSAQPLSPLMLSCNDLGTKTSVVQYYCERDQINPSFPSVPALQAGCDAMPVYLPMELCKIMPVQSYSKKLNEKQVTARLRTTCHRPHDREQSINKMMWCNTSGSIASKRPGVLKKEQERKVSHLSTLESSFGALNEKKFDVAHTVDLLYDQKSAQLSKDENFPTLSGKADESDEGKGSLGEKLVEHVYEACNRENNVQLNGDTFGRCGTWAAGHNDQTSVVGEDSHGGYPLSTSYNQENEQLLLHDGVMDGKFLKDGPLFSSLGFTSKQNAWVGPDDWKYKKAKGSEDPTTEDAPTIVEPRNKRPDVFAPSTNRAPCNATDPEDCNYQPVDLHDGAYGYPIERQAQPLFVLKFTLQMLKPEGDYIEFIEMSDKRTASYQNEEYPNIAVEYFRVIPDLVFNFIGSVTPARMDFQCFLVGNCKRKPVVTLASLDSSVEAFNFNTIQALFFFVLRCTQKMLKPEEDCTECNEWFDKRITTGYHTEEYSNTAVKNCNANPGSIPALVFNLICSVSPAHKDFQWVLVGKCKGKLDVTLASLNSSAEALNSICDSWYYKVNNLSSIYEVCVRDLSFSVKQPVLQQTLHGADNVIDYFSTPRWKRMGCLKKRRSVPVDNVHLVTKHRLSDYFEVFDPRMEHTRLLEPCRRLMNFYIIGSNMDGWILLQNGQNVFFFNVNTSQYVEMPNLRWPLLATTSAVFSGSPLEVSTMTVLLGFEEDRVMISTYNHEQGWRLLMIEEEFISTNVDAIILFHGRLYWFIDNKVFCCSEGGLHWIENIDHLLVDFEAFVSSFVIYQGQHLFLVVFDDVDAVRVFVIFDRGDSVEVIVQELDGLRGLIYAVKDASGEMITNQSLKIFIAGNWMDGIECVCFDLVNPRVVKNCTRLFCACKFAWVRFVST